MVDGPSMTGGMTLRDHPHSDPQATDAPLAAPVRINALQGECLTLSEALGEIDHWRALAESALEHNQFFGPDFLPAYLEHMAPASTRIVVARHHRTGAFHALAPVGKRRLGLGFAGRAATFWSHNFAPLGTPLVNADANEALETLCDTATSTFSSSLLAIPFMRLDGPVYAALKDVLDAQGQAIRLADHYKRASLDCTLDADAYLEKNLSGNRRQKLRRSKRTLAKEGDFASRWFTQEKGAVEGFEAFLTLEASGWKGDGGSAISSSESRTRFARQAVRAMAARGRVGVLVLSVNETPVAANVILLDGPHGIAWKTAYDEKLSRHSPGVMSIIDGMHEIMGGPELREVDSLTEPGHTMIEPLWHERIPVATVLAAKGPFASARLALMQADIKAHHNARALAKKGLAKLRAKLGR